MAATAVSFVLVRRLTAVTKMTLFPFIGVIYLGDQRINVGQADYFRAQGTPDERERCRSAKQGAVSAWVGVCAERGRVPVCA